MEDLNLLEKTKPTAARSCIHCGTPVPVHLKGQFCCQGCELVYALLKEKNLSDYYKIREKNPSVRAALPGTGKRESYSYLDDPEIAAQYLRSSPNGPDTGLEFFVEGGCIVPLVSG